MDIKTAPIGHTFSYRELRNQCSAVWGAVAWPGRRPGFAVVVGLDHKLHLDNRDVFLLEEFESCDVRRLVRQCGALDLKYHISLHRSYSLDAPDRWIGDYKHDAASRFIQERNEELQRVHGRNDQGRQFSLDSTSMLDMEKGLYSYILPQIKELMHPERRRLFLKDSKVANYLGEIEESEITELERGSYPAIEALAFAVIEMLDHDRRSRAYAANAYEDEEEDENPNNYASRGDNPINY
jgi:hypothetical protein